MKVKMLVGVNGKVNGERMGPYVNGREYSVPDEMPQDHADLFMGSAMAEEVTPAVVEEETIEIQEIGAEEPRHIPVRRGRKQADSE